MDRASSLIFPGSRTLVGWWRQLSPFQPLALAVGYAFLHRIEAPVITLREEPLEPLTHHVLQALALEESGRIALTDLQDLLHLPAVAVERIVANMQADGLLDHSTVDRWQMTELGQHALQKNSIPVRGPTRRVFPFVERMDALGQRVASPSFLPIAECFSGPWSVDGAHRFDLMELRGFIGQPLAWKQRHAFPMDVEAFADGASLEVWQQVVVDRPERVMLVLMLVNGPKEKEVRGLAVKVDGWTLNERVPVLAAPADAVWPAEPALSIWQEAWRSWCKQRQLPTNEVDACTLTYQPPRLEVQAPARLVQRLQAAKSDLFKGDAWLLVGDGYMRTAVQLSVRSA